MGRNGRTCRFVGFVGLVGSLVLAAPASLSAAAADGGTAPPLGPGQAAMSGYWHNILPPGMPFAPTQPDILAKMQPWVAAKYAKDVAAATAGQFVTNPNTRCMPAAVPGTGSSGGLAYSMDILVEPRQATFLYELNRDMRFVYIDQDHPAKPAPSWEGNSVGHWEGDTLVVDTIGYNDKNVLMLGANLKIQATDNIAMTSKMHIVERYRMTPNGQLEDVATFDDPGAFTAPFTLTTRFERTGPFQEYICQENNHEGGVPTSDGGQSPWTMPKPLEPTR